MRLSRRGRAVASLAVLAVVAVVWNYGVPLYCQFVISLAR